MLTPTGALILCEYATGVGAMPRMLVTGVGYGAGDRELAETPNVVRVFVGEADLSAPAMRVAVLACEIDDMNPQIFGAVMDRLYADGALEVFYQPVQMKKNRPGTLMTIVCSDGPPGLVRRSRVPRDHHHRHSLPGDVAPLPGPGGCVPVETAYGVVRFKIARKDGAVLNAQPEFEDLVRAAAEHGVPIKMVQAAAQKAWVDWGCRL